MDKQITSGIEQFLRRVDEREFIDFERGKVVVRSDGVGNATVRTFLSPIHGQVDHPVLGPFDSVEALCDGIYDALVELSGEEVADGAYDHFIYMISTRAKVSS